VSELLHYILATAGHVDHGKSALVRALTGTDPDRLPEEKARGITIDLGFASLQLTSSNGTKYQLGIIDVPGHEDFVKNMVAGVGSIDLAMLVVAADDGWMPQTEEHLQILGYLGVTRGIIALTKSDLIDDAKLTSVRAEIRERLRDSALAVAPIVSCAALVGRGLEEIKNALVDVLSKTPPPRDIGKPRLPVDRVFVLKGAGTVVTGTLSGGPFTRGQNVVIQPAAIAARIRTIQTHNSEVQIGLPGSRVALNLPDLSAGSRETNGIARGDCVTIASLGDASKVIDVMLERSPRMFERVGAPKPLRNSTIVKLHHGAAAVAARVRLMSGEQFNAGEQMTARLVLDAPIFALIGDRFVIRDWAEQHTLGGGIVLDLRSSWKQNRTAAKAQQILLEARGKSPDDPAMFVDSQLARDGVVDYASLLKQSRFSRAEIEHAVAKLSEVKRAVHAGDIIAEIGFWTDACDEVAGMIDEHHKKHPEQAGLLLSELRQQMRKKIVSDAVFEALLADVCGEEFVRAGAVIRRRSHRPALPPRLQAAGSKIRKVLADHPLDPPSRKELAVTDLEQQALRFLILSGEVIEAGQEIVISADAYAETVKRIREHLSRHKQATVSELKELLRSSRRIMVPLLERLDRDGITRRKGEVRILGGIDSTH
jgi:selenocysteine-specific elongation factor